MIDTGCLSILIPSFLIPFSKYVPDTYNVADTSLALPWVFLSCTWHAPGVLRAAWSLSQSQMVGRGQASVASLLQSPRGGVGVLWVAQSTIWLWLRLRSQGLGIELWDQPMLSPVQWAPCSVRSRFEDSFSLPLPFPQLTCVPALSLLQINKS